MPWTYSYNTSNTAESCAAVKQELEDDGEEAEVGPWENLYADHDVKDELVFEPEQLQQQDVAMQYVLPKSEDISGPEESTNGTKSDPNLIQIDSVVSVQEKTLEQLTHCFVRLERIVVDEKHTSVNPSKETVACRICNKSFLKRYINVHMRKHKLLRPILREKFLHTSVKSSKETVACSICNRTFLKRYINVHMRKHKLSNPILREKFLHTSVKPSKETVSCRICNKSFLKRYLNVHMRKHKLSNPILREKILHTSVKPSKETVACRICNKSFLKRYINVHMRKHKLSNPILREKFLPTSVKPSKETVTCRICSKSFLKRYINVHMRKHKLSNPVLRQKFLHTSVKPSKETVACRICNKSFLKRYLNVHMRKHKLPDCNLSEKKISRESTVLRHKENLQQYSFICCNKKFFSTRGYITHSGRHTITGNLTDGKTYYCRVCDERFRVRRDLDIHVRLRHLKSTRDGRWICTTCGRKFLHKKQFYYHKKYHLKLKKSHRMSIVCEICQLPFVYRKALESHKLKHHGQQHVSRDTQSPSLVDHESSPERETAISCYICKQEFEDRNALVNHVRVHVVSDLVQDNDKPRFTIHESSSDSFNNGTDDDDIKTQSPELAQNESRPAEIYDCDVCKQQFEDRKNLLIHMQQVHTRKLRCDMLQPLSAKNRATPHVCKICQKAYFHRRTLLNHIRFTHLKEKPYRCRVCQQDFSYIRYLRAHLRTAHYIVCDLKTLMSEKRLYFCDICQRTFVYKKIWNIHMGKHIIGKDPSICPLCSAQYRQRQNLIAHMWRMHKLLDTDADMQDKCQRKPTQINNLRTGRQDPIKNTANKLTEDLMPNESKKITQYPKVDESNNTLTQHQVQNESKKMQTHLSAETESTSMEDNVFEKEHTTTPSATVREHDSKRTFRHSCDLCNIKFLHRSRWLKHKRKVHWGQSKYFNKPVITPITSELSDLQNTQHLAEESNKQHDSKDIEPTNMPTPYEAKIECNNIPTQYPKENESTSMQNGEDDKEYMTTLSLPNSKRVKSHFCAYCRIKLPKAKVWVKHMRRLHWWRHKHLRGHAIASSLQKSSQQDIQTENSDKSKKQHPQSSTSNRHKHDLRQKKTYGCNIYQEGSVYKKVMLSEMEIEHLKSIKFNDVQSQHANESDDKQENESGKLITPPSSLANNKEVSTQEKPHSCDVCQKRFVHKKNLLNHMKKEHPESIETTYMWALFYRDNNINNINTQRTSPSPSNNNELEFTQEKRHSCHICKENFAFLNLLFDHVKTSHPELIQSDNVQAEHPIVNEKDLAQENIHFCHICQKYFALEIMFLIHMQEHEEKRDKQDMSSISFKEQRNTEYSVNNDVDEIQTSHLEAKVSNSMQQNESNEQISSSSGLINHEQLLTRTERCSCAICGKRFAFRRALLNHMNISHPESTETKVLNSMMQQKESITTRKEKVVIIKAFECKICDKKFFLEELLLYHMQKIHPDANKSNIMQENDSNIVEIRTPKASMRKVLQNGKIVRIPRPKAKIYKITQQNESKIVQTPTPKPNTSNITQDNESEQHTQPSVSTNKPELGRDKPYSCHFCQKRFTHLSALCSHEQLRIQNPESSKCKAPNSDRQFTQQSALNKSEQNSIHKKPYSCDICQKSFALSIALLSHRKKRHSESIPSNVDTQNKQGESPPPLPDNKQDLARDKPHPCSFCDKKFVLKKVLLNHMHKRHRRMKITAPDINLPQDIQTCEVCHKKITSQEMYIVHMEEHKQNDNGEDILQNESDNNDQDNALDTRNSQATELSRIDNNDRPDSVDDSRNTHTFPFVFEESDRDSDDESTDLITPLYSLDTNNKEEDIEVIQLSSSDECSEGYTEDVSNKRAAQPLSVYRNKKQNTKCVSNDQVISLSSSDEEEPIGNKCDKRITPPSEESHSEVRASTDSDKVNQPGESDNLLMLLTNFADVDEQLKAGSKILFPPRRVSRVQQESGQSFRPLSYVDESNKKHTESNVCVVLPHSVKNNVKQYTRNDHSRQVTLPFRIEGDHELQVDRESNRHVMPPIHFVNCDRRISADEFNSEVATSSCVVDNLQDTVDESSKFFTLLQNNDVNDKGLDDESNLRVGPSLSVNKNDTENKFRNQITMPASSNESDDQEIDKKFNSPDTSLLYFENHDQEPSDNTNSEVNPHMFNRNDQRDKGYDSEQVALVSNIDQKNEEHADYEVNNHIVPPFISGHKCHDCNEHADDSNCKVVPYKVQHKVTNDWHRIDGQQLENESYKHVTTSNFVVTNKNPDVSKKVVITPSSVNHNLNSNAKMSFNHAHSREVIEPQSKLPCARSLNDSEIQLQIYRCNVCRKNFAHTNSVVAHMKEHSEDTLGYTTIQFRKKNIDLRQ